MPELDLSRRIVYPFDGSACVARRDIVYKRDGETALLMDVYSPSTERPAARWPALVFVHGGPIPKEMLPPREWGFFKSYGELAAHSGLAGVVFNHRLFAPGDYPTAEADLVSAIDDVRA